MSNARNSAKLINKLTPTASGLNMTGTLDVSANLVCQDKITLTNAQGNVLGGKTMRPVHMVEADNSTAASSSVSSLMYHTHDLPLQSDFAVADTGTVKTFRFVLTATGNARYVENTDDPGFEPIIQLYNFGTAAWANFSDSDNIIQGRWTDRGSSNYLRTGYHITTNLRQVTTGDYVESYSSNILRVRINIAGVGGTSGDDLDAYYNAYTLTVLS